MLHQNPIRKLVIVILILCLLLGFSAMGFPGAVLNVPDVQGLKSARRGIAADGSGSESSVIPTRVTASYSSSTSDGGQSGIVLTAAPTHFFRDTYSVFQYCRDEVCEYTTEKVIPCTETVSKLRVQGAFLCIHCVAIIIQIGVMILEIYERYIPVRRLPYIMFAWVFVTILITWAVMVGTLNAKQCGASKSWKDDGAETGDAFPILLVDFMFAVFAIVIYTIALNIAETDSNNDLWMKLGSFGRYMMRRNGTLDGSTELADSMEEGGGKRKGRAKSIIITRRKSEVNEAEEPLLREAKSTGQLNPNSTSLGDNEYPVEIVTASNAAETQLGSSWVAGGSSSSTTNAQPIADSPVIEALDLPPKMAPDTLDSTVNVGPALDVSDNADSGAEQVRPKSALLLKEISDDEPEDLLPPPAPRPGGAPMPSSMLPKRPGGAPIPSGSKSRGKAPGNSVGKARSKKPVNPLPEVTGLEGEKHLKEPTGDGRKEKDEVISREEDSSAALEIILKEKDVDSDEDLLAPKSKQSSPPKRKNPPPKPKAKTSDSSSILEMDDGDRQTPVPALQTGDQSRKVVPERGSEQQVVNKSNDDTSPDSSSEEKKPSSISTDQENEQSTKLEVASMDQSLTHQEADEADLELSKGAAVASANEKQKKETEGSTVPLTEENDKQVLPSTEVDSDVEVVSESDEKSTLSQQTKTAIQHDVSFSEPVLEGAGKHDELQQPTTSTQSPPSGRALDLSPKDDMAKRQENLPDEETPSCPPTPEVEL